MRSRASALMLAPLLACALAPAAAFAAPAEPRTSRPYTAVVDGPSEAATLQRDRLRHDGVGLRHVDSSSTGARRCSCRPRRRRRCEARGVETDGGRDRSAGRRRARRSATARTRSSTSGAPTRSRAASPTRCAPPRPPTRDVMKLEQIGTTTLGKPILVIKMTADARNMPDGARRRCCSRRSTTRVSGSRPSRAAACRSGSPSTRTTRRSRRSSARRELWFMPIQNVDGYDFTFTCGLGADQVACDYRNPPARQDDQPLLAQDDPRQQQQRHLRRQPGRRRPEPQLPGQARRSTKRARATALERHLPRPVRALRAGQPRGRPPAAPRQVLRQHQLPHRRPAAADPGQLHDRLRAAGLDDLRGHDRHRRRQRRLPVPAAALVGPLRVQRRHDRQRLPELRHHRLDAGDGHLRDRRRRRRLPRVLLPGRRGQDRRPSSTRTSRSRSTPRTRCSSSTGRRTTTTIRTTTRSSRPRTSRSTASTSPTAATSRSRRSSARRSARPTSASR